jgi:hypothetical protein
MGFFWSAVDEAEWPQDPELRAQIDANLDGPYGDRRTEIVIIGRDMDQAALTEAFDACLLTDQEFAKGPNSWATLADPFPAWIPSQPADDHSQVA